MADPVADPDLNAALAELGFSSYEARAYVALLGRSALNGHEVAKASGIPPSKIYETLTRLADKGAVLVNRARPVLYAASPREAVLESARRRFQRAYDVAETALSRLPLRPDQGRIWSLSDREAVILACQARIDSAAQTVFAALWDEELAGLGPALEAATHRGCRVHVAIYGSTRLSGPRTYDLTLCGSSAVERLAGRRLSAVVVDGGDAIVAEFQLQGTVKAVATSHPVVSLLVTEYIKADILGRLLIDDLGEARFDRIRHHPGLIDALLRA